MKNNVLKTLILIGLLLVGCSEDPVDEVVFGSLTGTVVTKGNNTPLSNAKITSNPVSTTVFTDIDGSFEISDIQIGEYSVQVELDDYQTSFEAATIFEGKTANILFELDSLQVENVSPLSPLLLFPEDGATGISTEAEFFWSSSQNDQDEISYTFELRNGLTNEILIHNDLNDTTIVVNSLIIGKNYFWQVTANDGVNESVQSSLGSFTTDGGGLNRFLYVRNVAGNNVIFSGDEPIGDDEDELNQNEIQLTNSSSNSYRPSKNQTVSKIAFLRSVGAEIHLFTMGLDGSNLKQVTSTVSIAGFRPDELEYSWYEDGAKFYFPNFNKLYSINQDGSGLEVVYEVNGQFISEVAVNPTNDLVVLKINDSDGYNSKIVVVDVLSDTEETVVESGQDGALGGIDFSTDGAKILYTKDVSGAENSAYRQLDSRIFEFEIATSSIVEVDTDKSAGSNDLDAKYAPDDGSIIFVNTSNDGLSEKIIYRTVQNANDKKEPLFTNAFMPNWE